MNNGEASIVTLTVGNDTNTAHVTTTSGHSNNTGIELDEVGDLASSKVNLDGVVDLDGRVWVTDTVGTILSAFRQVETPTVDLAPVSGGGSTKAWTNG